MKLKLPIKHSPRYSARHTDTVYAALDNEYGEYVSINGKCGWETKRAARNALSHLLGADHSRERFRIVELRVYSE